MSKNSKENGSGKRIRQVACSVNNCAYNDKDCHCTAEKISVGPSYAKSCTDTVCATFTNETEG